MKLETIKRWLAIWKELLEDPQELLLGKSFVNAARAISDEPNISQRGPVGRNEPDTQWKRRLFGILEQAFDSDTVTIDYLRAEWPTDVAVLQTLLHDPIGYDVGQIVQHLNNIKGSPSIPLLRRELHQELLRDKLDEKRLTALLKLLLRHYVTKVSPEVLTKLPKTVLTRRATTLILSKHARNLADDEKLNTQTRAVLHDLIFKRAITKRASKLSKKNPTSVFDIFGDGLWWNLSYRLVEDLAKPLAMLLRKKGDEGSAAPTRSLLSDEGALREIGLTAIEGYIQAFLRRTLSEIGRTAAIKKRSSIKKLGMRLGDYLIAHANFNSDRSIYRRPDTLDHLSSEAVFQAAAKAVSVTAALRITSEGDAPLATAIGRLVAQTLADAAIEKVDWNSVADVELETICAGALARKDFHKELGDLLKGLNEVIRTRLKSVASDDSEDLVNGVLPDITQFWDEWIESFSLGTGTYTSVFNLLPWLILTDAEFSSLLDDVLDYVLQPQENWLVGFTVYEILPQGTIWTMGNITFFDPAVYDFGEGRWFVTPPTEPNEAVTFANVSVTADTSAEAIVAARRNLNDALNVLSFVQSAGVKAGGLKPEVHRNSFVINVSTRKWTGGWTLTPAEMPTEHGALGSELTSVAAEYDSFLGVAARQPSNLTELQEGFLRALYWYRKGRWESDPAEKFSFYWIALEHLVKNKGVELPYIISKLHITWRDVNGARIMWRNLPTLGQLEWWREAAVEKIKSDLALRANVDASTDLRGWDTDPHLLLRPEKFDLLVPLVPAGSQDERFFKEYKDEIRKIEGNKHMIASRAESMRVAIWFRLRLLYRVRNQLFHEALTYRPDIEVYVAALEAVLEDTLKKMVSEVTAVSPKCRTMDELVAWYQKPWM
jgi:hypothetical protein